MPLATTRDSPRPIRSIRPERIGSLGAATGYKATFRLDEPPLIVRT